MSLLNNAVIWDLNPAIHSRFSFAWTQILHGVLSGNGKEGRIRLTPVYVLDLRGIAPIGSGTKGQARKP